MSLTQLLFSFKGRIRRLHWWVASLGAGFTASLLTAILEAAARSSGEAIINPETHQFEPTGIFGVAISLIGLANAWIAFALSVKRLHDRDRTGWWLLWQILIVAIAAILIMVAITVPEEQGPLWYALAAGASLAALVITVWLFVQIGFLRGTQGPNRFGTDPLGTVRTTHSFRSNTNPRCRRAKRLYRSARKQGTPPWPNRARVRLSLPKT
jgi:uncharacterized membrane protein YhaH (DUF805 family)